MEIKWHDARNEKPGKNQHVLIWLVTGEIVSASYDTDSRTEPFYEADMEDFDGHYEFYEDLIKAWALFPRRSEIRKEE